MKIGDKLKFGPYDCYIIAVVEVPNGRMYDVAYFDTDGKYLIARVYDFELNENEDNLGFKK